MIERWLYLIVKKNREGHKKVIICLIILKRDLNSDGLLENKNW